jgi:threonine/homoserine/homoserine lactone efflux protein
VLYVVGRALAHGRRTALATALGHAAGNYTVAAPPREGWRAARDGAVVGLTNPKGYILFGAILPQFVNRAAGHVPEQMLVLALVSVAIGAVSDCSWGFAASAVRAWFARSPRRFEMVGGAGGLAMIGVGVTVAVTGRHN